MARNFVAASSHALTVNLGACNFVAGKTLAAIVKRTSDDGTTRAIFQVGTGAGTNRFALLNSSADRIRLMEESNANNATTLGLAAADGWCILAVTKAAGTSTPRFHKYVYSTATWSHEDSGSTIADGLIPATDIFIGHQAGGVFWNGDIEALAVWGKPLTDSQIEGLAFCFDDWLRLVPRAAWGLNQVNTADGVFDRMSKGANQVSITGTTVVAGPSEFSYGSERFDFSDHPNSLVRAAQGRRP